MDIGSKIEARMRWFPNRVHLPNRRLGMGIYGKTGHQYFRRDFDGEFIIQIHAILYMKDIAAVALLVDHLNSIPKIRIVNCRSSPASTLTGVNVLVCLCVMAGIILILLLVSVFSPWHC